MPHSTSTMRRPTCLMLVLALLSAALLVAAASAANVASGASRAQRMEAKRAFDRAKLHPTINDEGTGAADDVVEYRAADGTTKTMSRADLEAKLRQQQEGGGLPQMGPDGSLSKQQEGKATVEELREKDPFLAGVVDAGKYAISRLQAEGVVGAGARLKSLHSLDDEEGIEERPKELHLRLIAVDGERERTFEVRLEGSYLARAVEVSGPGPNDRRPIPLSLRPPSSASPWELLLANSPLPPTLLLLVATGVVVLLLGVLLVALGGAGMRGKEE